MGTQNRPVKPLPASRGGRSLTRTGTRYLPVENPVVDLVGDRTGRIVPLYPQSEKAGLTTWELAAWVEEALTRAGDVVDPLPERWRDELDVVNRTWALHQIHVPESMGAAQAARKRLALDELLRLQLILVMRKRAL